MAILLGLSLLLVQYVVDELPLILDIVSRNLSIQASQEGFALLVEVPSSAIPRRFYRRFSCWSDGLPSSARPATDDNGLPGRKI
jgi:hypothetical protein